MGFIRVRVCLLYFLFDIQPRTTSGCNEANSWQFGTHIHVVTSSSFLFVDQQVS